LLHGHARGKADQRQRVADLLLSVGLEPDLTAHKFPHELSGGQRQRINIARALAVQPEVLVADEPTSMLDVSIRLGILELLARIKRERELALLYITHDIATAAHVAEEIVVLFAGQMVEWGSTQEVIARPRHLYTQLLLSAVPDPGQRFVPGDSARFLGHAEEVRRLSRPASQTVEQVGPNHFVRALGAA
jgi:ABC-type oligopeptide transport system ATPase subunit